MVFNIGDKVYARGHKTNMWYEATVTAVSDSQYYTVQFEDGSVFQDLNAKHIASESRFRTKSRSRSRSRGRSKSPSRKAKQSPSPSRKVKETSSPARARSTRSTTKKTELVETSSGVEKVTKSVSTSRGVEKVSKSVSSTDVTDARSSTTVTHLRQSARLVEKLSLTKQGNGDGSFMKTSTTSTSSILSGPPPKKQKVGVLTYLASFLAIILIPTLLLSFIWVCTPTSCLLKNYLDICKFVPRKLCSYWDPPSVLLYSGYLTFQFFLKLFSIGRAVDKNNPSLFKARYNSLCSAVVTMTVFCLMVYYKCGVTMVYVKFHHLAITGLILSFLLSVGLYLKAAKSTKRNEDGNTGCISHDFFMGREVSPHIGHINIKVFILNQVMALGCLCAVWSMVVKSWEKKQSLDETQLLVAVMHTVYMADVFLYEDLYSYSMFNRKEGCGFSMMSLAFLYALIGALQARYLVTRTVTWTYPWMAVFITMFLAGYIIRKLADSQKNRFRRNPHHAEFANMKTMPTTGGKQLLVDGWWGIVRHPNYLGEIIMTIALVLPCGFDTAVLYLPPVLTVLMLLVREKQDSAWCRQKHGAPWEIYCKKVKYAIVPFVY